MPLMHSDELRVRAPNSCAVNISVSQGGQTHAQTLGIPNEDRTDAILPRSPGSEIVCRSKCVCFLPGVDWEHSLREAPPNTLGSTPLHDSRASSGLQSLAERGCRFHRLKARSVGTRLPMRVPWKREGQWPPRGSQDHDRHRSSFRPSPAVSGLRPSSQHTSTVFSPFDTFVRIEYLSDQLLMNPHAPRSRVEHQLRTERSSFE